MDPEIQYTSNSGYFNVLDQYNTGGAFVTFQSGYNPPWDPPPMGVREPRRPTPSFGPTSAAVTIPVDYPAELDVAGILERVGQTSRTSDSAQAPGGRTTA